MDSRQMTGTEKNDEYIRILDRMRHLCSTREYCSADIRQKISKMMAGRHGRGSGEEGTEGDTEKVIDGIIASLESDGYLSDMRYAAAFARDKAAITGWGRVKIRYALGAKGIDGDIISAALGEIDGNRSSDRLERLVAAKYRSLAEKDTGLDTIRMKVIRYATGRGYSYDEVADMLQKVMDT